MTHSDPVLKEQYEKVIAAGGRIAGPAAEELQTSRIGEDSLNRLKTNFFETELELGHCLRAPTEGPCACDPYLRCSKFLTTSEYAPRLRPRLAREQQLTQDGVEGAGPARSNDTTPSPTESAASSPISERVPSPALTITAERFVPASLTRARRILVGWMNQGLLGSTLRTIGPASWTPTISVRSARDLQSSLRAGRDTLFLRSLLTPLTRQRAGAAGGVWSRCIPTARCR